ncbi:unnamed protein product [Meloidogyne enterolobii]|uniref:Uncharacterized protein n=1 Tax=Meloidogyne enterolobii TaxID=390850 RepID=A0ACB1B9G6_MELEN
MRCYGTFVIIVIFCLFVANFFFVVLFSPKSFVIFVPFVFKAVSFCYSIRGIIQFGPNLTILFSSKLFKLVPNFFKGGRC